MFERLKRTFSPLAAPVGGGSSGLLRWGAGRMMNNQSLAGGAVSIEGLLLERPFKAGCAPSSRPYISGIELMGRADLHLRDDVNIIVMHRSLKRELEKVSAGLYSESVEGLRTTEKPLPEEVAWLSMYRDAGWPGPSSSFWARYCVLTDNVDLAREWLDTDSVAALEDATSALRPTTPFLIALTRGKAYLRLQMEAPDDALVSERAMDALEQLSARAVKLFGR